MDLGPSPVLYLLFANVVMLRKLLVLNSWVSLNFFIDKVRKVIALIHRVAVSTD